MRPNHNPHSNQDQHPRARSRAGRPRWFTAREWRARPVVTDLARLDLLPHDTGAEPVTWPIQVRTRFTWDAADPWAVAVAFDTGHPDPARAWVCWWVGVELLTAAVTGPGPVGHGDVVLGPDPHHPARLLFTLTSDSGRARFRLRTAWLAGFLDRIGDPHEIGAVLTDALDPADAVRDAR